MKHAETYWNLIAKIPASSLNLTKIDDEIHHHLLESFPEFRNPEKVISVDEDEMKSNQNKPRWREFMEAYENKVEDYNFGTLLRRNCRGEYSEQNTMFVPRMQFYAIEIYRNKIGINDWVKEKNDKGEL